MAVQTLRVPVPDDIMDTLRERASRAGCEAEEIAGDLLVQSLRKPSLDELLAPFRRELEESGLSEEDFDALVEQAREEAWKTRRKVVPRAGLP